MYNQSYDEYIRSILGYSTNNQFGMGQVDMNYSDTRFHQGLDTNNQAELEACYPDIYKVIYPMVQKACQNIAGPVTKETIDRLTDEIYLSVEGNDQVFLNINLNNNVGNVNSKNQNNRAETMRKRIKGRKQRNKAI